MPFVKAPTVARGRGGSVFTEVGVATVLTGGPNKRVTTRIFLRTNIVATLLGKEPEKPVGVVLAIGDGEDAGKVMISPATKGSIANARVRPYQVKDNFVLESVSLPTTSAPMEKRPAQFEFQGPALVITLPFEPAADVDEEISL